jgi:hypothetical protein
MGIALASTAARAQDDDTDTTWDDLGLDPEGFKLDDDIFGHVSTGWFPQPYTAFTFSVSGPFFYQDVWDHAPGIRPRGFRPTTEPFSDSNPYDSDEREILQPNSEEEEDDGYPTTEFQDYSVNFLYNLPFPMVLRANAGVQISDGLLFSNDNSRSYLTIGGAKQQFKEVGVAHLKQYSLVGTGGIVIPVYGGFIKNESTVLASYYYIYGGYSLAYAVSSKGTQYSQIASAKDQIRYGNGADTVTLIYQSKFEGLNRLREAIEVGIGWNLAFDDVAMGMEAFVSLPRTSVLDDVECKQYFAGFRISLGYQWFPKKRKPSP